MASTGSLLSQTLQDITNTKLNELALKRETFDKQHQDIVHGVQSQQTSTEKLLTLAEGVKTCFSISTVRGRVAFGALKSRRLEIDVKNLDRFLAQARYDPSVSSKILGQWEQSMFRHLQIQSTKYMYASLYGNLTTEWLSTSQEAATSTEKEDTDMGEYERVEGGKKLEARLSWERSVFEPVKIDNTALYSLLKEMFQPKSEDSNSLLKALHSLRESVEAFERDLFHSQRFNSTNLGWVIEGLLASDLLTDEKRAVLREFKDNTVIINEVADVLNMRMATLQTWSWGTEVPLEQRRQLNGTYNIYMHEDLLQAMFLQYIGVKWSVFWKGAFSDLRRFKGVWKSPRKSIPTLDLKRREFFLGPISAKPNVESQKQSLYRKDYFLAQLLNSETQTTSTEEGEEEADFEDYQMARQQLVPKRAKQTARKQLASQAARKVQSSTKRARGPTGHTSEEAEEDEDAEFDDEDANDLPKNPMEAKQSLLHLLSTEIFTKCRLHGEITCLRSQFESLFPSLPHATIECVLEFFGVSKKWLHFFKTFLQAPLKFIDDESSEPRMRRTGTPGSHVLSEVFGEVVLFCLEFKVNQDTQGELLWRTHDDFWFWSSKNDVCVRAWSLINTFANTTGLKLNQNRTGSARMVRKSNSEGQLSVDVGDFLPKGQIRWGMLFLNPDTGRFEIDQKMVDKHIDELSRQLESKTDSVFAWIQAWNSYAATFFTSNFGKASNCFGRQHVDNMLATHNRIQKKVFSSSASATDLDTTGSSEGNIIDFLKQTIEQRFGVTDIPDGYFYFPTELGGLEVRNPFIRLLQIRDTVLEQPDELFQNFEEAEKEAYKAAKRDFDAGETYRPHKEDFKPQDHKTFFSFAEYTKYREQLNYGYNDQLLDVFNKLLKRPSSDPIDSDDDGSVKRACSALSRTNPNTTDIRNDWYWMEPYWKWVAQLYGPEMIERFGGFGIVEPGLLPMGMVGLFRGGRVKWME